MKQPNPLFSHSRIVATGSAVPAKVISNREIERRCEVAEGWIEQRTGIRERRVVSSEEAVSDLAIEAGKKALHSWQRTTVDNELPGMLILATSTPDHLLPPTAPFIAHELSLGPIPALDIAVACSGFIYALQLADGYCRTTGKSVLIIAANVLSKRVNPKDLATAAVFGDAAGAVILSPSVEPGLVAIRLASDGSGHHHLKIPDGGSRHPFSHSTLENQGHTMSVENGMAVFRYAVEAMAQLGEAVLEQSGISVDEIDFWIPHQANLRIIESVRIRLGIETKKTGITIDRYANSSAATIPLTLDEFMDSGDIQIGDRVLMTTAAAGLTSGAAILRI